MVDIEDVLEKSDVFQSIVTDALRTPTPKVRRLADLEVRIALRYFHKLIESEQKGRTKDYWLEADHLEFKTAIELGLVEQGPEAERAERVVHYLSSTQYGRTIYDQIKETGYDFAMPKKGFSSIH